MSQISIEPLSADELNQLQKSASSEALGDSIFEKPTYTPSKTLIEQQMQNLLQTDDEGQEIQPQKLSLKDLENDKE
jgi:hypothetical protein